VLELGHGPGHLLIHLDQQGFAAVGLDASPQMVRLASRRLARAGRPTKLVQAQAEALPFAAGVFDSVVATFPSAYVMDPATLAGVSRVLRPEGRLVIVIGARLCGHDPLSRFIEWLYQVTGQRTGAGAAEWKAAFDAAGLIGRLAEVDLARSRVTVLFAELAFRRLATRRVLW
jgi:ubiquinone/menaquinone biosynthesis C-methylase UbiE